MPDEPAAPPISRATMEQAAGLSAADAVKLQLQAQKHRSVADYLEADGDRVGPRFERAEAKRLEHVAELGLDPVMHATGPIVVGNGGEMAIGVKAMRPFVDTVRERPDMLAIDASQQRMELADKADVLTLAVDAAQTIRAENSLEKMLMGQLAAAHALGMRMAAAAGENLAAYNNNGRRYPHLNVEACRTANAAARLMDAYQRGLLTLERMRNGGRQVVTVQHVNISGGQAVVAGSVGGRKPGDGQE